MDNIQMNQGIAIMQTALWIVGLFTLLSGIVGVSNIMLTGQFQYVIPMHLRIDKYGYKADCEHRCYQGPGGFG